MGEHSETVAANGGGENNGLGSSQAHHVGISPQENRGGAKGTVGEVQSGEEEGGIVARGACCCEYAAGFLVFHIPKCLRRFPFS